MKKFFILSLVAVASMVFVNCNPGKKITEETGTVVVAKSTYEGHLSTMIVSNCSPCHIPSKGGRKKPYDNYANVKTDIDEMIRRMELNPTDPGFMPFKAKTKLPDSTINAFKKWRDDGMLEK